MLIKILAFADDTTAVGKLKDKECIQRVFAHHAEKIPRQKLSGWPWEKNMTRQPWEMT